MLERFIDFAYPRDALPETHQFRSSWLASSLRALQARGLTDAYRAHLPARLHAPIFESVAGLWLPVEVAVGHYAAIDALGLPLTTIFEMGREIQDHSQATLVQLALRTSKRVGVTPWVIFENFRRMWDRTWRGGDFAIDKAGPKEAQIEIVGWSVAPSQYVRHAMRGVFDGVMGLFCQKVYVRELPRKCVGLSLGYRIAWV